MINIVSNVLYLRESEPPSAPTRIEAHLDRWLYSKVSRKTCPPLYLLPASLVWKNGGSTLKSRCPDRLPMSLFSYMAKECPFGLRPFWVEVAGGRNSTFIGVLKCIEKGFKQTNLGHLILD